MRAVVRSGAQAGASVRTHFTHFMTVFEHGQLVPGGESRGTKSLNEDPTNNLLGQMTPTGGVKLRLSKLQTRSP